jgi:hypothetical protein
MMPTVGKAAKTPQPKLEPTRAEAVRAAKARITLRNSLRKGCSKGQNTALVSGVDFLIKVAKVRQPLHRQAVFVFFALDVHFHQMLGKPFTGTLGLGTVCKSAIYDQCAING